MNREVDMSIERSRYFGKGLDVGTSFVRSAERSGQEVVFRAERNAFASVDQSDFTESMLAMADMECVKSGDDIFIVGNAAMEFANVSDQNVRRPLRNGLISPSESEALPMIEMIVSRMIGPAGSLASRSTTRFLGEPLDAEVNLGYHKKTLQSVLQKLGYNAKPINEGLAVVFAELGGDEHFTGIGMSFGGVWSTSVSPIGLSRCCCSAPPEAETGSTRGRQWLLGKTPATFVPLRRRGST